MPTPVARARSCTTLCWSLCPLLSVVNCPFWKLSSVTHLGILSVWDPDLQEGPQLGRQSVAEDVKCPLPASPSRLPRGGFLRGKLRVWARTQESGKLLHLFPGKATGLRVASRWPPGTARSRKTCLCWAARVLAHEFGARRCSCLQKPSTNGARRHVGEHLAPLLRRWSSLPDLATVKAERSHPWAQPECGPIRPRPAT